VGFTTEGDLIVALEPAWRAIVAELRKDPSVAFKIDCGNGKK